MIEYPLIVFLSITMGVLTWIAYGKVETHQRAKREVRKEYEELMEALREIINDDEDWSEKKWLINLYKKNLKGRT